MGNFGMAEWINSGIGCTGNGFVQNSIFVVEKKFTVDPDSRNDSNIAYPGTSMLNKNIVIKICVEIQ